MPLDNDTSIFCADLGSEASNNFGWCGVTPSDHPRRGSSIDGYVDYIVEALGKHPKIAIGFEAPLFVPYRDTSNTLLQQRLGEAGSPFSAGAGAAVLVTALVQVPYILKTLREKLPSLPPLIHCIEDFRRSSEGIFFWEAFVSGEIKNADQKKSETS